VDQPTGGVPGYFDEGFLYLQNAVETTLAKILSKNDSLLDNYDIKLQRFAYPMFIDDKFLYTLQGVLPLTLILSFIFPVINITKLVLVEKEKRLKEYMMMNGTPNWLLWASWFVKSFLFLALSTIVITILLKVKNIDSKMKSLNKMYSFIYRFV
jgi:ATP-binding cassette subfamily A (ABC1) protein 3